MRVKPLLLLVLFLLLIPTAFSQYLDCNQYTAGTVVRDICNLAVTFRSFLGISIMFLIMFAAVLYTIGQTFGAETRAKATVWAENVLIAIFIASMVYLVFSEQNLETLLSGQFPSPYLTHILIALFFGVMWVALFYIPGYFLQHPPLQLAAKEELGVLIMGIVILLSWTVVMQLFTNLSTAIVAQSTPGLSVSLTYQVQGTFSYSTSHLDIAYGSLEIFFIKLRTQYTNLYLFEVLIGFLSTISFPIGSPLPAVNIISFSLMPFDGLVLLSNAHTVVVEAIGYLMSVIWAKQFIILLAKDVVPTILLPFGLVMRAFPWFRATGSSLIAICIVIYFVYPLAVMFSNYLLFDVFKPADFLFTPNEDAVSFYKDPGLTTSQLEEKIRRTGEEAKEDSRHFMEQFEQDEDVVRASRTAECEYLPRFLCSIWNILTGAVHLIGSFVGTMFNILRTMVSFSGDWLDSIIFGSNPLGAAGGLYRFIIEEVIAFSQLIIIITVMSVIEIIITITMYRNISDLIGGEVEIAGLTKLV